MATPEVPHIEAPSEPESIPEHNRFARHLKRFFGNDELRAQKEVESYLKRHEGEEIDYAKMFADLSKHRGRPKSYAEGQMRRKIRRPKRL